MFLTDPGSMTVQLRSHPCDAVDSMRRRLLLDVAKVDVPQLLMYWETFSKVHPHCLDKKWSLDRIPDEYKNLNNNDKEIINMETTELYDYKKLAQYDAESESLRLEENAPNAMHFLAYALSKHDKDELDIKDGIDRQEIDRQVLSTFFFMAVAAGYDMAQEKK